MADWNLQTNLKNKPNAQGTLFSGGKSQMNPAKRYPRGYTPDRMREVQKNTIVEGWQTGNIGHYMSTRHDVLETLARSTAPTEHMHGLGVAVTQPEEAAADGIYGDYHKGSGNTGHIRVALSRINGSTVIHELGHHVSANTRPDLHVTNTPYDRGREEGFADHYADKHFIPDPASKKKMLDDDRRGSLEYGPGPMQTRDHTGTLRPEAFSEGYNAMRPEHTRVPNTEDHEAAAYERHLDAREVPVLPGLPQLPFPKS